jgi:hypothetical protein
MCQQPVTRQQPASQQLAPQPSARWPGGSPELPPKLPSPAKSMHPRRKTPAGAGRCPNHVGPGSPRRKTGETKVRRIRSTRESRAPRYHGAAAESRGPAPVASTIAQRKPSPCGTGDRVTGSPQPGEPSAEAGPWEAGPWEAGLWLAGASIPVRCVWPFPGISTVRTLRHASGQPIGSHSAPRFRWQARVSPGQSVDKYRYAHDREQVATPATSRR